MATLSRLTALAVRFPVPATATRPVCDAPNNGEHRFGGFAHGVPVTVAHAAPYPCVEPYKGSAAAGQHLQRQDFYSPAPALCQPALGGGDARATAVPTASSHAGAVGTIRRARPSDAEGLLAMLEGPIASGSILPVTADEIRMDARNYFIYQVGGQAAGCAYLKSHGAATAELSKICTAPQFKGRGVSGQLIRAMTNVAAALGKQYVFALSTDPTMCRVFERLGFRFIAREHLCPEWRRQYNLDRPSRAFYLPVRASTADLEIMFVEAATAATTAGAPVPVRAVA